MLMVHPVVLTEVTSTVLLFDGGFMVPVCIENIVTNGFGKVTASGAPTVTATVPHCRSTPFELYSNPGLASLAMPAREPTGGSLGLKTNEFAATLLSPPKGAT